MAYGLETQAVHGGRGGLGHAHVPPIDLSSTARIDDPAVGMASIDALAMGAAEADNPIYARLYNPTVARFEQALAALEGLPEAVAFGSGMAAISACLMAARARGDHVVAVRPVYGGTDHLLNDNPFGLAVTWVDAEGVHDALRPTTALVVVETPANPTLALVDIAEVVRAAGPVPVLVDNTFATPVLQRPAAQGAQLVVHSATKFIGGHGDVVAGVVATTAALAAPIRQMRIATGGLLHPFGAYLLHRGLQTLPLRVRAAQRNARLLAAALRTHPAVVALAYPELDPRWPTLSAQMAGPGSLMALDVGDAARAGAVLQAVRLCTPAVSLGSVDTLIQHPAGLTHRVLSEAARAAGGITPGLLRLSVGVESVADLRADLWQALDCALAGPG